MRHGMTLIEILIVVAVIIIICTMIGGCSGAFHHEDKTITVTDKAAVPTGKHGYKYLIYAKDTTYEIDDTFVWWRFDSSDWYGRVQPGHTYHITAQGYRVPFLSWYQNIVKMDDVTANKAEKQ